MFQKILSHEKKNNFNQIIQNITNNMKRRNMNNQRNHKSGYFWSKNVCENVHFMNTHDFQEKSAIYNRSIRARLDFYLLCRFLNQFATIIKKYGFAEPSQLIMHKRTYGRTGPLFLWSRPCSNNLVLVLV